MANVDAEKRSNIDHMQLDLLCKEAEMKMFTVNKVFENHLTDLHILESVGIQLDDSYTIKGG